MNPTRVILFTVALLGLGARALQAESVDPVDEGAAASLAKPWDWERQCSWWLSGEDGRELRASIGQGDEGLVLSLADPVFLEWPEEDRPRVELVFDGDARRQVSVEGWSTHIGTETAIFGLELDTEGIRMLAGATSLELRRDGRSFLKLPLEKTPKEADLEICVPSPIGDSSDQE